MVHVKTKPQHVVFCLHSKHQLPKLRVLLVESAKMANWRAVEGRDCPESGADGILGREVAHN